MLACFILSYPFKAGLVGAGVPHDQLGQVARSALDAIFLSAAHELLKAGLQGAITVGGSE